MTRRGTDTSGGFQLSPGPASVIVAVFTLLGGVIGAAITSRTTLLQTDKNADAQIQQQGERLRHEIELQNTKQKHEINLERQKFVQQTIAAAVGKGTEEQQRQALRFYATVGIIEEPYAKKILELPLQELPVASAELQQRLVFSASSSLPADRQKALQSIYSQFIEFLEKSVGFPKPPRHAVLEAYSPEDAPLAVRAYGQNVPPFYHQELNTIFISRHLLDNTPLVLREYTHVALATAIDRTESQTEVESGLSDYFPASFLAANAGARDERAVRLLQDLGGPDTKIILEGTGNPIVEKGAAWTAALWRCHEELKPDRADKLVLKAWQAAHRDQARADRVGGFGAALLEVSRADGMKDAEQCYRSELERRKLPSKPPG
jgi:hypothetical protein